MIHVFNSSIVSGPEKLVLPALQRVRDAKVVFLMEERSGGGADSVLAYARSLGIECYTVSVGKRFDLNAIRSLAKVLRLHGEHLVHAHDVKATLYSRLAMWIGRVRLPLCSTHHGVLGRPTLRSRIYERFYRYVVLPFCSCVFAVSTSDRSLLKKYVLLKDKVALHLNGIRTPLTRRLTLTDRNQLRAEWGVRDGKTAVFGWIGRLSHEKRPLYLVEVAKELLRDEEIESSRWKICIFGEGPLRKKIERKIKKYGLEDQVVLLGYRTEIGSLLQALDCVLNTSQHEGLPISLLEAAHCGVPVCAVGVGGIRDLIISPEFGEELPPQAKPAQFALAVASLIADRKRRKEIGVRLKLRVSEKFSEEVWLQQLRTLYSRFLSREKNAGLLMARRVGASFVIAVSLLSVVACSGKNGVPKSISDKLLKEQANVTLLRQQAATSSRLRSADPDQLLIRPGMTVSIRTVEDESIKGEFQVSFAGELSLPYEVKVEADGLTPKELEQRLKAAYRKFFRFPPSLILTVVDKKQLIEVQGLVQKPGKILVSSRDTLDEIISQAGGLGTPGETENKEAKYVRIIPVRGEPVVISMRDYYAGASPLTFEWNGGDRVFFQSEPPSTGYSGSIERGLIKVLGQIQTPGEYPYREGENFFHYLVLAGGPTEQTDFQNVEILRLASGKRESTVYDLTEKDVVPEVSAGDIVIVHAAENDETIPNITNILNSIATALIAAVAL